MALIDVPAADPSHVERRPPLIRRVGRPQLRDLRDGPPHGLDRVRGAERRVAVPAGPLERHAVAAAAHGRVDQEQPGAVDRDEPVDPPLHRVAEELLHPAQVAEPLLADVRHEGHGAIRLDAGAVERAGHGQQDRQPPAVVPDAGPREDGPVALDPDVGAFREHRVEVRRHHKLWPRQHTRAIAEDVARLVDADVCEAQLLEGRFHRLRSRRLLERGRGDLAQADLIGDDLRLVVPDAVERRANGRGSSAAHRPDGRRRVRRMQ